MNINHKNTDSAKSDKLMWLANQIFTAFPEVKCLRFFILDCGCIYYQRVFKDGYLDSQTGIYRDAEHGPCGVCLLQEETWKDRVVNETMVYNGKVQIIDITC